MLMLFASFVRISARHVEMSVSVMIWSIAELALLPAIIVQKNVIEWLLHNYRYELFPGLFTLALLDYKSYNQLG